MRQTFLLIMALVLSIGPALALELRGECRVHFTGSSTLHDFDGTGNCEPFVLRLTETTGGEVIIPETVLAVAVAGMQTGNASRDDKMRQMFGADRFPVIAGVLDGAPLAELRRQLHEADRGAQPLPLRLRIRDVEVPASPRVTQLVDDARGLSFDLDFPISLAAYRLEPPSVLGLIRVADEVRVKISLSLAPLPTPWQP
jgi:hypothetical protein